MVRATKILEIIQEEDLLENARVVGTHLLQNLLHLQNEFPSFTSNARGLGLFCAMDVDSKERRELLKRKALEKGLILIGCSERTIRFRPPLNISTGEIDEGIAIIRSCLKEIAD
jgi:L-lysine 6-transaminase